MTALAHRPLVSLVDVIDAVLDSAKRLAGQLSAHISSVFSPVGESRVLNEHIRSLESLRDVVVTQTRAAFAISELGQLEKVAEDLGRRHWAYWGRIIELIRALESELKFSLNEVLEMDGIQVQRLLADHAEDILPALQPEARRDLRSTAFFCARMLSASSGEVRQEMTGASFLRGLEKPAEEIHPIALRAVAFGLALSIGGTMGGIDHRVLRAITRSMWDGLKDDLSELPEAERRQAIALLEECRLEACKAERRVLRPAVASAEAARKDALRALAARDYEALAADAHAWRRESIERETWDATTSDGLES